MATMTISLPEQIAHQIDETAAKLGFATRSEFIRNVLRRYFAGELEFKEYGAPPLSEVRMDLKKTGKYSKAFIDSVVAGLRKSSAYAR